MTSEDAIFIYLDQNQWVYLSQAYHNRPEGKQFKPALDKLIELVNKGKVRLPLSFYHFAETQKNQNKDQRDRLAEFMAVFSQGWGIAMLDSIAPVEIQIAGAKLLGYSPPNKPKVFARDISLILNLDIELIAKTATRKNDFSLEESETFYPFFKEFLLSPQMLKQLIAGGLYDKAMYDKSVQGYKFGIEQYAKLSKEVRAITNEFAGSQAQLKRKVISDYLTGTETKDFINNALSIYNKTIVDITSNSEAKAIAFLESIPILDIETTLITLRNMQHDREIHENDWADLNALVVAVPYCDIVVTEKFFHNLTVRSKLDKKYNTIVLKNLNDLLHHL